jgi:Peptidase_C39 like family
MTGEVGIGTAAARLRLEVPPSRRFVSWRGPELSRGTPEGTFCSPELDLDVAMTDVIVSWTATTPPGTWLQVELRGVTESGETTAWFVMGRWAADDDTIRRTSVPDQADRHGDVLVDRYVAAPGHALTRLQVRVVLHRAAGSTSTPQLRSVSVIATRLPTSEEPAPTASGAARGIVLDVPRYSQNVHKGEYPEWDAGGEAWCSPTSTAMVLAFWGAGPDADECAWVDPAFTDPCVHHAVRGVYDHGYQGAGNWPFNVAYAGERGLDGFVTKLRSLEEAEAFVAAGVPLVLSLSFGKDQIRGLSYATKGHLLVLVGFTADGSPVLNDPASPSNGEVRKAVDRSELETAWLTTSQGVVYVIHPESVTLPAVPGALS